MSRVTVPISIDTYKASVARDAVAAGATIVNDISGLLYDDELGGAVARTGAALVLMHTRGRSHEMYELANYTDVVVEVSRELRGAMDRARTAGVAEDSIILDPGFGFAKKAAHSVEVLARLDALAELGRPLLSGPSRKSFLKSAIGEREPSAREWATAAAVTASVLMGAHIIRVHGVKAMVDVVRTADLIRAARIESWQMRCSDTGLRRLLMAHWDHDRPDDSNARRHDNSVAEETSATGQRIKGAIKDAAGELTGDEALEDKGERENAAGKDRQRRNDAV